MSSNGALTSEEERIARKMGINPADVLATKGDSAERVEQLSTAHGGDSAVCLGNALQSLHMPRLAAAIDAIAVLARSGSIMRTRGAVETAREQVRALDSLLVRTISAIDAGRD